VGFEGGEAVAEVRCGVVKGCAGEVTHRGDGGVEFPTDFVLKDVELGVAEASEFEGEAFADEESSNDVDSAGLCERVGGQGIDE
jgi:hypothetical protein